MGANSSVIPYLSVPVYDQLQTSRRPIPPFPTFLSNLFYDLFQTIPPRNWADPGRIFRQALPVLYSRAGAYSAAEECAQCTSAFPLRCRSKIAANRESHAHMRVAVTTFPCNVAVAQGDNQPHSIFFLNFLVGEDSR